MSLGIILGIVAMLGFGLNSAISKYPTEKIGERQTMVWRSIFITFFLLIPSIFFIPETEISLKYLVLTIIISLTISYLPLAAFFKALKRGKVGVVVPLANSYVIFTFLFSYFFYQEDINSFKIISLGIIILGIFLLSFNLKDFRSSDFFKLSSGVPYALITCLGWGFIFFYFKIPVNYIGPILTSLIIEVGILIASYVHLKIVKQKLTIPPKKVLWLLIISSFCLAIASVAFNWGIKITGQISLMSGINAANPLVAVIYGAIVYKEKLKPKQYLAALVIILGVISLAIF